MTVAAVVFDFDGVLADSEPLHLEGLRGALATKGLALPSADYYRLFLGFNDEDALQAMSVHYGWNLSAEAQTSLVATKLRLMTKLLSAPSVLFPEASRCVRDLAGILPLAIASGATREEIDLVLRANDLDMQFRCVVASGETPHSKPAPDPYVRAVELLQTLGAVPPGRESAAACVAIEDSAWGIRSAKAAGLRCIGITTSYEPSALAEADHVVSRLSEVTPDLLVHVVGGGRAR